MRACRTLLRGSLLRGVAPLARTSSTLLRGASSLETEDNLARLDRSLAKLFAFVDEKVGLNNTLIVLSADHGQPEIPGHLQEYGIRTAHYFDTENLDRTPAIEALKKRFASARN